MGNHVADIYKPLQSWLLNYRKKALERVQKWFTRILPDFESITGKIEAEYTWFAFMEHCRLRGNLKSVYKIMKGLNRVNGWSLCPT